MVLKHWKVRELSVVCKEQLLKSQLCHMFPQSLICYSPLENIVNVAPWLSVDRVNLPGVIVHVFIHSITSAVVQAVCIPPAGGRSDEESPSLQHIVG